MMDQAIVDYSREFHFLATIPLALVLLAGHFYLSKKELTGAEAVQKIIGGMYTAVFLTGVIYFLQDGRKAISFRDVLGALFCLEHSCSCS